MTEFSYWTIYHGSSLRLCNIISITWYIFEAAFAVMRSYNFLHVCQWVAFQYLWPSAKVQHCGPLQHSHIILFIRFHNPKEPCEEGENKKRASSLLPSPTSFIKFHFILLSLFKKLFLFTCIFRCCNPALQSSELACRQATSHSLEQSEKPVSTTTLRGTVSHTETKSENHNSVRKLQRQSFTQLFCFLLCKK